MIQMHGRKRESREAWYFETLNLRIGVATTACQGFATAVTDQRIVAYAFKKRQVNVPFTDNRIQETQFTVEGEYLVMTMDAGLFQPTWSGTLEYKFCTLSAQKLVTRIETSITKSAENSEVNEQ